MEGNFNRLLKGLPPIGLKGNRPGKPRLALALTVWFSGIPTPPPTQLSRNNF